VGWPISFCRHSGESWNPRFAFARRSSESWIPASLRLPLLVIPAKAGIHFAPGMPSTTQQQNQNAEAKDPGSPA